MVRVLLCHYFKAQQAFHDLCNPSIVTASKEFLFIATTACNVSVYSLNQPGCPLLYQFPTISKVVKFIFNDRGNYVATLESKQRRNSPSFVRVYFNWFQSQEGDAVRAVLAGHSIRGDLDGLDTQFVAVQLPTNYSVTAINSCPATGNMVVAGGSKVALFRLCTTKAEVMEDWTTCCDLEHLLDVVPGFDIKGIALCDCYLAMRSELEIRVIKLVFGQEDNEPIRDSETESKQILTRETYSTIEVLDELESTTDCKKSDQDDEFVIISDECIFLSFDKCSLETASSHRSAEQPSAIGTTKVPSHQNQFLFPSVQRDPVYKDKTVEPKVVLGPVINVDGHPVKLELAGLYGLGFGVAEVPSVCGITMLYRRFRAEQLVNDNSDTAELHSLQLLPMYTKGLQVKDQMKKYPLVQQYADEPSLCGMCCMVSGPKEGYIYDVFSESRLLSCYKFTNDTKLVTTTNNLLHAITRQGLETYTVRMYAAAAEWVRKENVKINNTVSKQTPHEMTETQIQLSAEKSSFLKSSNSSVPCVSPFSKGSATLHDDNMQSCSSQSAGEHNSRTKCSEPFNTKPLTKNETLDNLSLPGDSCAMLCAENKELPTSSAVKEGADDIQTSSVNKSSVKATESENESKKSAFRNIQTQLMTRMESPVVGVTCADVKHCVTPIKMSSTLKWTLPVHDIKYLKQWSPPADLDVCLIGMYPFVGSEHITASEDNIVLFTRAPQDSLQRYKRTKGRKSADSRDSQQEWSVYILENMSAVQLYKTIMPLASRCQKHNLQAHHHLVCEQHLFLRSFCVKKDGNVCEDKQLEKCLSESAANLAHFYGSLKNESVRNCTELYNMSGLSLRDVVDKNWKSTQIGDGFIHYLDEKLFGSNESVIVSKATAKKIFRIYSKVKPCRVAEVVLMSSLGCFSPESAVDALQDLKKSAEDPSFFYRIRPLDNLVLAMLYLHLCEPDQAQSALFSVPKKQLIEVVVTHNYLLHEDRKHLTPLAQLLRKHQPETFLDILLSLHDCGHMMLDTILALLEVDKPGVRYNNQAVEFLEAILNDELRRDSFEVAAVKLCDIYIQRLVDTQAARRRPAMKSTHQHIPRGTGHFASRFAWLDKLPPFEGCIPTFKQCPYVLKSVTPHASPHSSQHLSAISATTRRLVKYSPVSNATDGAHRERENCCCCCCMESLLKLQALLCFEFTTDKLCKILLVELQGKSFKGDLSIKLLCLPHVGHHLQAVKELLSSCPEISVYYGKQYFRNDIERWSNLLHTLLDKLKVAEGDQSQETEETSNVLLQVLKGTLSCMASCAGPSVLLSLLPDEGSLGFFLPYLEQSYHYRDSGKLSRCLTYPANKATFSV